MSTPLPEIPETECTSLVRHLLDVIRQLQNHVQELEDEILRLKGFKTRPIIAPSPTGDASTSAARAAAEAAGIGQAAQSSMSSTIGKSMVTSVGVIPGAIPIRRVYTARANDWDRQAPIPDHEPSRIALSTYFDHAYPGFGPTQTAVPRAADPLRREAGDGRRVRRKAISTVGDVLRFLIGTREIVNVVSISTVNSAGEVSAMERPRTVNDLLDAYHASAMADDEGDRTWVDIKFAIAEAMDQEGVPCFYHAGSGTLIRRTVDDLIVTPCRDTVPVPLAAYIARSIAPVYARLLAQLDR